jgi:RNA polymerase sigma-70 factor (ECF subfamily)
MKSLSPTLLRKFRNGNELVLESLYNRYYEALVFFGQKYIPCQDVVEDIVQESFIKLWEKRKSFFHEASVRSFLYKAVRNACINQLEHIKVCKEYEKKSIAAESNNDNYLNHIIEEEVNRTIAETVQELPESSRLIYLLSLKGVKNAEIAEDLNISVNTVKTQKQRATKYLKENLKNLFTLFSFL